MRGGFAEEEEAGVRRRNQGSEVTSSPPTVLLPGKRPGWSGTVL